MTAVAQEDETTTRLPPSNATPTVLIDDIPGATGSGILATLVFFGAGIGSSTLALSDLLLLDSTFADIAGVSQNGALTVASQGVPEPASLALFLLGMGGLLAARRKLRLK